MHKNNILYKIVVGLLIFCMVFEGGAMQVLASGYDGNVNSNPNSVSDTDVSSDSGNDFTDSNSDSGNNLDNTGNTNSDNNSGDASAPDSKDDSNDNNITDSNNNSDNNSSSDANNNPNDNSSSDNNDNPNDNGSSDSGDGGNSDSGDNSNDNDASDPNDNSNNSDNPNADTTPSEDDVTDDSELSEDDEIDEPEADSSESDFLDDIETAETAFSDIASDKSLMALIYLTDTYHVRSLADTDSAVIAELESGHTVYILGVTITPGAVWYKVQFWLNGVQKEGYIEHIYLAYSDEDWLKWMQEYLYKLADDGILDWSAVGGISTYVASYADIDQFPAGYQNALTQLKSSHPNWTFVPMNTKLDFNTAVSSEMGDKSLIQNTTNNASKGWVGSACPTESGWYYATRDAVAYYMDPRNFLTETYIFQFEQLTFNSSYHTVDAIQSFLNSTFMKGTLDDDSKKRTYAQAFYEIGSARKLSPIHLASRVYQEQGQGNSGLISGKYPGYEGYYNYFNVNVNGGSDTEKIVKGLTYAKQMGWNTRYKSLEGGAATIGNNYILKSQDTPYLQKFNVDSNSPYGLYNHQYMQNIQAPASESSTTKKMYSNTGSINSPFVFKIPVYSNMPGLKLNKTKAELNKGETLTLTASVNGTAINSSDVTWKSSDTSIVTVVSGTVTAKESGTATVTATYDGNDATCTIVVVNPLRAITLDKDTLTLRRPDTIVQDTAHLSPEELSSNISSASLNVIFDPEDTTSDKTIVWSSSNKKVATVTDGIVTAVGAGEATITAKASKAGNKTAQCKVTVIAPVYNIEFSSQNNMETILAGQSINLSVEYFPKDTTSDTTVLWESSDTSVATVARTQGTVRAVSAGTADITATIGGYSASHKITVESCTVTFMDTDNSTALKTLNTSYGAKISQEDFPDMGNTDDSVFVGWYTGVDGTGSRFDHETQIHQKETIVYPCFKQQGKGFYVIPVGDQTYTGSPIKPEVIVYDGASLSSDDTEQPPIEGNSQTSSDADKHEPIKLILNKDYTVTYKNNKKAASSTAAAPPTIIIKGKGNYAGTQSITFNIVTKSLTDTDITAENITAAYTGKTIKGSPILYHNNRKLIKNTDYKLTYPQSGAGAYQKAGTYPIIVTGIGGYHGTITVYETISSKILLSKVKIARIPNQPYDPAKIDKENGIGIEPELTVTYKNKPLTESQDGTTGDYIVTYRNNMSAGTATATITAVASDENLYAGSKSITFKITAVSISKAVINGVTPKTYTGMESDILQDSLSVSLNGNTLTQSIDDGITGDYILEYKIAGKSATVTVKGINKYTGTKKKSYKITPCDLSQIQSEISYSYCTEDKNLDNTDNIVPLENLSDITTPYVKGGAKPTILLSYKGNKLTLGKDYTVKYKNNNAITTSSIAEDKLPTIIITGKGLYKGKITSTFHITKDAISDDNAKITMTAKDIVYKDKKGAYKTSVVLTDVNGKKLQAGKDYDKTLHYTYADGSEIKENDIPSAGTAIRITVNGMGAYAGENDSVSSKSAIYHIVAADISKAKVTVKPKEYNNGNAVILTKDDITVTLNGTNLVFGEDYEIISDTYVGNCKKGKASVTIKGTGAKYGGSKKISFTIKGKTLKW